MKDAVLAIHRNFGRIGIIILMTALVVVTVLQVMGRIMNFHVPWIIELSRYLLILLAYVGLSEATKRQEHIGTEFLQTFVSGKVADVIWLMIQVIFLIFSIYMVFAGSAMVIMHYQSNQMTVSLPYNFKIAYISLIMPLGFAISVVHIVGLIYDRFTKPRNLTKETYHLADEH
jgi:TRAP-type transport system small permease protein